MFHQNYEKLKLLDFKDFINVNFFPTKLGAAGRILPPGVRYVTVNMTDSTRFCGYLILVPQKKLLDDPHSLRPLWMTIQNVQSSFKHYSIYMEMSYRRRYTSEPLERVYGYPDHQPGEDFPREAYVHFGVHKYLATNFIRYSIDSSHPNIADDEKGGRIYITIKSTSLVYYSDIEYKGVSMESVPYLPSTRD